MPIYEYECPFCGRFEVIQSSTEKPLTKCEKCASAGKTNKVQRVVSPAAFHLKGGGWYKTDYASNGSSKSTSKGGASSESSDSSKDGSSAKSDGTNPPKGGGCGGGCACH